MKSSTISKFITIIATISCLFIYQAYAEVRDENSHTTIDICGKDFNLSDSNGKNFSTQNLKGKYSLIYFGFTTCAKTCPVAMHNITLALNELPEAIAKKIQPIFITLDPETDNNQALNSYIKNYDKNFIALTGTQEQLGEAKTSCKIYAEKVDNELVHSSLIYLLDKNGKYLTSFVYDTEPKEISKTIRDIVK